MPEWVQVMLFFVIIDFFLAGFHLLSARAYRENKDKPKEVLAYIGAFVMVGAGCFVIGINVWRHLL